MPATTLVCPHCEKTVEIQVSSVTRSRPCPECGQIVMLQMAEKSTKTKRRALLMGQNEAPPAEPVRSSEAGMQLAPAHPPQALPGDAFERMRMDPEVLQFRRRLFIGGIVVGSIILALVLLSIRQHYTDEKMRKKLSLPSAQEAPAATTVKKTEDTPPPPVNSGNLVFRLPGNDGLKTATSLPVRQNTQDNLAKLAAGEEVVRKFLEAADWRERALLVRNRLRAAPLMSIYYEKNADGPLAFDSLVEATEAPSHFTEHIVVFEGGGRRLATVEHLAVGPRVDWESFVGAGEMAWSDFLSKKTTKPTLFRVIVSPAGHFENQFGDPSSLKCYSLRVISEPGAKVVYGYADKSSTMAREIDYLLQESQDATVPMILRLKFPPDAPVDFQVWVHQLVQAGWVMK